MRSSGGGGGVVNGGVDYDALRRSMERLGVPGGAGAGALAAAVGAGGGAGVNGAAGLSLGPGQSAGAGRITVHGDFDESYAAAPGGPALPSAGASLFDDDEDAAGAPDAASLALSAALSAANHGPGARPRALAAVRRALRAGATLAPDHAGQILAVSLEALAAPDSLVEVRAHALATLRDLAQCAPEAFAPHANIALPRILDALDEDDDHPEVTLAAVDALDGVVEALPAAAALRALAPHVGGGGAAPVRSLGGVIARMAPEALMRYTPDLLPGLVEAFNSSSADVRKAVVDTLVAMYDSLGDWLLPQLSGLSPAQQKLVTIYINRAAEMRGNKSKAGAGDARVPLAPRHM